MDKGGSRCQYQIGRDQHRIGMDVLAPRIALCVLPPLVLLVTAAAYSSATTQVDPRPLAISNGPFRLAVPVVTVSSVTGIEGSS
jgi:hypothetical protein